MAASKSEGRMDSCCTHPAHGNRLSRCSGRLRENKCACHIKLFDLSHDQPGRAFRSFFRASGTLTILAFLSSPAMSVYRNSRSDPFHLLLSWSIRKYTKL